jgi:hypothetical protein
MGGAISYAMPIAACPASSLSFYDVYFRYFLSDAHAGFFLVGVVGCDDTDSAAATGSGIATLDRLGVVDLGVVDLVVVVAADVERPVPVLTDMMRGRGGAFLGVDVAVAAAGIPVLPPPPLPPSSSSLLLSSS